MSKYFYMDTCNIPEQLHDLIKIRPKIKILKRWLLTRNLLPAYWPRVSLATLALRIAKGG